MFAQPNGMPIDPRRDQHEWKALLKEPGVREARLHDARHRAATTLLLLGVPGASRHGRHGLVEQRDGQALCARRRSASPGDHGPAELILLVSK